MPTTDSVGGSSSIVGNLEKLLALSRANALRIRLLCALCVALLALQAAVIVTDRIPSKNLPDLTLRIVISIAVIGVIVYLWRDQSRILAEIEESGNAVREQEGRDRIAGLTVAEGIVSADATGRVTYFNYAAERIFGRTAADTLGQPLTVFIPHRFHDAHTVGFHRYIETGVSNIVGRSVELIGMRGDEEFPLEIAITHVKQEPHNFFTAVVRDISTRKRAEQQLRESEERFRLLIQNVRDYAILTLDENGCVTTWNEGAQRIKGYTADEIVGQHFSRFYPPEDIDAGKPEIEIRVAALEGRFEEEGWRVRKDGTRFWANVVLTALRDDKGRPRGFAKVTRDISDRKRTEDEIRKLNTDLARRNEELASSNHELEAFTYSVAHDLRAPLRHISGFSRILSDQYGASMDDQAREYIVDIRQGAERMGMLIDDLLSLTKITRQEIKRQVTGLDNIVSSVMRTLEPETKDRDIDWRIGELPFVECDPVLITQVYANLLSNAIKYTRPRKPAVIELGKIDLDGEAALFVRDNGVGFNDKYADKLFGVFQRLHRAEDFEGTGVGLATVQRIVHKHGGRIWAEAEIDKGATFYFTVGDPARVVESAAAAKGAG